MIKRRFRIDVFQGEIEDLTTIEDFTLVKQWSQRGNSGSRGELVLTL